MAHIRRTDGGGWQVRYRDPAGRERARNFRRKADAERFSVTVETDKIRGMWADPRLARITVSEWLPTWQASRVHLRPSTRALAESLLRNHVLPYFGDRRLGSVTPTDVQGFVAHLEEKGLAASTVRQCYLLVAGLFSSALDSDIIVRSPCRGVNLPSDSNTEMRFLTADEVSDLAGVIDQRYRALVLTAAYAGCRFGELAGLKVHRLDLLRRTLTIAEALSEVRGEVRLAAPKTAAARRQVALPKFLAEELAGHLAEWPPGGDGFVFSAP
jgi:integrase